MHGGLCGLLTGVKAVVLVELVAENLVRARQLVVAGPCRLSFPFTATCTSDLFGGRVACMSTRHVNDPQVIRRLLSTPARWAVVGLTNNPARVAPSIARFLRDELSMQIIPVSLTAQSVLGEQGYARLADVPGTIDVVDCFVNSAKVGAIVDQAIAVGARAIWLQLGVIDEAAAARAQAAGLDVVMNTCPKIEYPFR